MPAKKKPGDSFRLPHRRHEYFNFFVPQPLGVVPMCESGRNILAKHKKKRIGLNERISLINLRGLFLYICNIRVLKFGIIKNIRTKGGGENHEMGN